VRAPSIAVFGLCFVPISAQAQTKIDGLSKEQPSKLLIFTVRGEGVTTPFISFQERTRSAIEPHVNARVISMDETLEAAGAAFQKKLAGCRGEPECLKKLVGTVDAKYLLVVTASLVGELRIVGSRLIDLGELKVLGEAVDEVPQSKSFLDVLPDRIHASIPESMWDPFGTLAIEVSQPGAQISIDGRVVGMSPIAKLGYLTPGDYRVEASKDGFLAVSEMTKIERAKESAMRMTLAEIPKEGGSSWMIWAGVGLLVAVAGAATAIVLVHNAGQKDPTFCSSVPPTSCQ
jgi:hypothetical protein